MSGTVVPIEEIGSVEVPPFVRLPDLTLIFARRAARLEALAAGHVLELWLKFMAALTRAQHEALAKLPSGRLPGGEVMQAAKDEARPPLAQVDWTEDPTCFAAIDLICAGMAQVEMPAPAREACRALAQATPERRAGLIMRCLSMELSGDERAMGPFLAAALQLYWTRMASMLGPDDIGRPEQTTGACPVCGGPPVMSLVGGSTRQSARFVACAMCNSQWNEVRIKCVSCGETKGIAYEQLEGASGALKAETCESCKSYLKIVNREKEPEADPIADDLASLQLDILVSEAGWHRSAPNPFLMPGEG
jgi:FdhE protein